MAHPIRLPQWSMGMTDATLVRWLRRPGDAVQTGDALAELESSKVLGEVVADRPGVLLRTLAAEGEVVAVRAALCLLGEPGEEVPAEGPSGPGATAPPAPAPGNVRGDGAPRREISPRARRLAREHGLDPGALAGSGPGGRVREADVRAALDAPQDAAERYSLRARRGAIATRLVQSLAGSAQFTLMRELDAGGLHTARERAREEGFAVSIGELLAYAVTRVLPAHPLLNGTVQGDAVTHPRAVHLGLAVAADGALVVPVIRDAHALTLPALAARARTLAQGARAGTLHAPDTAGGTFTVSNLGAYGVDAFTPILAPGQIAILGCGRLRETPLRRGEALAWRTTLTASLTVDHRVVDGAPAARFLAALDAFLADAAGFL